MNNKTLIDAIAPLQHMPGPEPSVHIFYPDVTLEQLKRDVDFICDHLKFKGATLCCQDHGFFMISELSDMVQTTLSVRAIESKTMVALTQGKKYTLAGETQSDVAIRLELTRGSKSQDMCLVVKFQDDVLAEFMKLMQLLIETFKSKAKISFGLKELECPENRICTT